MPADKILQSIDNSANQARPGLDQKMFLHRMQNQAIHSRHHLHNLQQPHPCPAPRDLAACSTQSPLQQQKTDPCLGPRSQPGPCVAPCAREPVQYHNRLSFANARARFECNRARSFRSIIRDPFHVLLLQHPRSLHVLQRQHTITLAAAFISSPLRATCLLCRCSRLRSQTRDDAEWYI